MPSDLQTLDDFHLGSTADVIREYNDMLAADLTLAQDSAAMLTARSQSDKLTFGGVPFLRTLRPHFMTPRQYAYLQQTCNTLAAAMTRLRKAALADPRLLDQLDLTPEERRLALVDPGFDEPSPSIRMDSFWSEHAWSFVECNGESPAAIAYDDVGSDLFRDLPCIRRFQERYHLAPIYSMDRFMQEIERQYAQFRANRGASEFPERPRIAIVDWAGVPTYTEFQLFQEYFQQRGFECIICRPEDCEYDGKRLRAGGGVIDLFYKRVLTSELLARPDVAEPITQAYVDGNVMVMNAFQAKILHKKMSFALLHDDANAHLFTPEQVAVIRRHIPWTRKVVEGTTTYEGGQIDLPAFVLANRDRLVLKPNDEYGGKGVYIGWTLSQSEWEAALTEALAGSFVVQEKVVLEKEPFPYLADNGAIEIVELATDTDPYIYAGDTHGVLTRLSAQALLNVTAGTGSVTCTMIVEPK
jgi:hypothetical protein